MRSIGHVWIGRGAAVLACLLSVAAPAEENPGWYGAASPDGATLFYGIPQSDYAPVSFSCAPDGNGLTFVFAFAPNNSTDSAEVEVRLQAGDIEVPIRTTGMHMEMGDLFVLEGKTVLDDQLTDLIMSDGTLMVFVEDGVEEYPLEGAREAAAPLLKACAGKAAQTRPAEATICRIRAWSTDTDPDGQNVRAGPGTTYAVIGNLPAPQQMDDTGFATEVSIVGSQDGWFRIDAATIDNYIADNGPDVVFQGDGWVSGRLLGLSVEGNYLFMEPSRHAPVTLDLSGRPEIPSDTDYAGLELERLHACMGDWAEVEVKHIDERFRGWTDDICSSQVTTCP